MIKCSRLPRIISVLALAVFFFCGFSGRFLGAGLCHARHGFTIEEEKKLGDKFKKELDKRLELVRDPWIQEYVDTIGQNILSQLEYKPFDFDFQVYVSSDPNAFAIPAGYIYISTGLIILAGNESELAGVVSHEIAHVTARHIAEKIEKDSKLSMGALAAILAGIFLGGGGKSTEAIGALSLATIETLSLKYSRDNEEEADRLGLGYLIQAGYDGDGMVDFLKKLKMNRFEAFDIPSYLSTHPDVDLRIHYLEYMLKRFPKQKDPKDRIDMFRRVQAKLIVRSWNPENAVNHFKSALNSNPKRLDLIYGLALAHYKLDNYDEAIDEFNKALSLHPEDGEILKDLGICYFSEGNLEDAIPVLQKSVSIDERDTSALFYLGRSYHEMGNFQEAIKVYEKLRKRDPNYVDVYRSLGVAYGKTGLLGKAYRNFGTSFKLKDKKDSALLHFNKALEYFAKDSKERREILREIEEIQKKEGKKKRGKPVMKEKRKMFYFVQPVT